jgi:hypothetical protein
MIAAEIGCWAGFALQLSTDEALDHLPQGVRYDEAIEMSRRLRSFFTTNGY